MGRWYRSRGRYDEREVMRRSERLFDPRLNLSWKWKGTSFELWRGDTLLWDSSFAAYSWEYPGAATLAGTLLAYINTPLDKLRRHEVGHVSNMSSWYSEDFAKNWNLLPHFLLAADRRIGKNHLSVWLFTEGDIRVRNIIGARV